MKDLLEEDFKDDPLRKEIKISKLEEDLYNENILGMHPETTYSTVEAGEIIGRKDSTLRNYFRTELLEYVGPERFGKYYRLDYKSVFKLHMILLLVEKASKTVADIAYFCGLKPLVSTNEPKRTIHRQSNELSEINALNKEYEQIKKILLIQNMKSLVTEERIKLNEYKMNLTNVDSEISSLEKEVEILLIKKQQQFVEQKYYKVLDYSLRNTKAGNSEVKWSFMNLFKGPEKTDKVDIDHVMEEALLSAEREIAASSNNEIETTIENLQKEIENKKKSREDLVQQIDHQNTRLLEAHKKVLKIEESINTKDVMGLLLDISEENR
jgi:hypothetical protein